MGYIYVLSKGTIIKPALHPKQDPILTTWSVVLVVLIVNICSCFCKELNVPSFNSSRCCYLVVSMKSILIHFCAFLMS